MVNQVVIVGKIKSTGFENIVVATERAVVKVSVKEELLYHLERECGVGATIGIKGHIEAEHEASCKLIVADKLTFIGGSSKNGS